MKKILCFLMVVVLFASCSANSKTILVRSYVCYYWCGPLKVFHTLSERGKCRLNICSTNEVGMLCCAPEIGSMFNDQFLKLAERNGDRSYDRKESFAQYINRMCLADNFKAIRVVCLNAAWDTTHPAGSLLNDITHIGYVSYAEYVRNGYPKHTVSMKSIRKALAELLESDLTMIDPFFYLDFDTPPAAPGSYEMQVTMTTTEGEEKVARCTVDF